MTRDAQDKAVHLAQHYFALIARKAGVSWDADNDIEIELMVVYMIDAAKAAVRDEIECEMRAHLDDAPHIYPDGSTS
jgi:ketosteroid isomerase-like protein